LDAWNGRAALTSARMQCTEPCSVLSLMRNSIPERFCAKEWKEINKAAHSFDFPIGGIGFASGQSRLNHRTAFGRLRFVGRRLRNGGLRRFFLLHFRQAQLLGRDGGQAGIGCQ